jgi:hypothetical protein
LYIPALKRGREFLGIPLNWRIVRSWLAGKKNFVEPVEPQFKNPEKKFPLIPRLNSYNGSAPEIFWSLFPNRPIPKEIASKVSHTALRSLIWMNKEKLTIHQFRRGMKIADDIQFGAESYLKNDLPPITVPNLESARIHGEFLTDKIASWIETGFVVGPFKTAPLPGFRANQLLAIARNDSIRPIINLSEPKGQSFNDNVDENRIEKVSMATAKSFSYSVLKAGVGSKMSKFDLKDAYKIVPVKKEDWKYQGFKWLNRYFFETQLIFGAGPSVANFDRLAKTLVDVTTVNCEVPSNLISRTLDDIPVVAPKRTNWTEEFSKKFRENCERLKVPLAENCPEKIKAFENSTNGTVLGINFNTEKLEWSLPNKKADKLLLRISKILSSQECSLKQMRSVMGSVNDFAQMCIFMHPFKHSGNQFLAAFQGNENIILHIPSQTKADLLIVANAVESARAGLPIAGEPRLPGLEALHFYTDAAGAKYALCRGKRVPLDIKEKKGVAGVGVLKNNKPWWWSRIFWSARLLHFCKDSKGAYYGNKMSTLEAVGILLPFLTVPEKLVGRELVFHVDNISVVYGWENGGMKNDVSASIILRSIHLICNYLGVILHITHVPRLSTEWAYIADCLSRQATTSESVFARVEGIEESKVQGALEKWLRNPDEDWNLPYLLLAEVEAKVQLH